MATTITIDKKTKERLADYKLGDWTYDEVLQLLMDNVSLEDVTAEHLRKHYHRLDDFKGLSKEDFKKRLKTRLEKRN
ncbi:MAG: hypothetical protein R6U17_05930, partial [Thermoplasmata archaeon]